MRVNPASTLLEFALLLREQWLPRRKLEALQWRRFKHTLDHAYRRSPFYRKRLREAGVTPRDIKDRRDLMKIPITRREDLWRSEDLIVRGVDPGRLKRSFTSGSTGRRTTTYFDRRAWLAAKLLLKIRARLACGVRPWDRIAIVTADKPANGRLSELLLRQRRFSVFEPLEELHAALERYHPTALYGFPSSLAEIAEKPGNLRPSRIFTSSEVLDPGVRSTLENGFGAEVFDVYGSTEVKELAWECPSHAGLHINCDWLLVEFLKNGAPSTENDASMVVSTLYNGAMPLLRYEIGDTGRLLGDPCPCGRGLPLMVPTRGRIADYLTLPDGLRLSPYAVTCALESVPGIRRYQVRQTQHDRVHMAAVLDAAAGSGTTRHIKQCLGNVLPGIRVEVSLVDRFEREPSGKFRIVASAAAGVSQRINQRKGNDSL